MSALSDYLEEAFLNSTLRGVAFITPPTSTYLALFTSDPGDTGTGTELTDGTAPGYLRVQIVSSSGWTTPTTPTPSSGSTTTNVDTLEFPEATGAWAGPITHFALFDAATSGHLLYHGALGTPRTINLGDVLRFSAGALVISVH